MQWLGFTKVEKKQCWNCKTAGYEPFNGVEDRKKVPGDRKHPWPTSAQKKRSVHLPQLIKNTRENLRRNPCRSCRVLATAAGVSKSTMRQVLRDSPGNGPVLKPIKMLHRRDPYGQSCGHAGPKMPGSPPGDIVLATVLIENFWRKPHLHLVPKILHT